MCSPREVDRVWGMWELIIYPKPYSIYSRGTIRFPSFCHGLGLGLGCKNKGLHSSNCWMLRHPIATHNNKVPIMALGFGVQDLRGRV